MTLALRSNSQQYRGLKVLEWEGIVLLLLLFVIQIYDAYSEQVGLILLFSDFVGKDFFSRGYIGLCFS